MKISEKISLKSKNTFKIDVCSSRFVELTKSDLVSFCDLMQENRGKILVIGEGSNILFTQDFDGIVVKYLSDEIEIVAENEIEIVVKVGGGKIWDDFVSWCTERNYWGIENLSLIPGSVGASPVQNIGAYGMEVSNSIEKVNFFNFEKREIIEISNKECNFSYRNSIFKNDLKQKGIIVSVQFKLSKIAKPILEYGEMKNMGNNPSIIEIRNKIIQIRKSKLPETKEFGNAGSFFKNPIVSKKQFELLKSEFPQIPSFISNGEFVKISAAWLISNVETKQFETENVALSEKHSLVIINKNNAKGKDILTFAEQIQKLVDYKFKIKLEIEVNIL
jgi:UDP-N-acetylmuramate dehydrogenase